MESLTKFKQALDQYRDPKYRLLGDSLNPNDPSGNALLYESHAAMIAEDLGCNVWFNFYSATDLLSRGLPLGLFRRKPEPASDFNTHDDYIGVAAYSRTDATNIVSYGTFNDWVYDNREPNIGWLDALFKGKLEAWQGRFPGLIDHYLVSSRSEPPGLMWYASIWWTTRNKGNESGWLLDYLKIRAAKRNFPNAYFTKLAVKRYNESLDRYYNGNLQNVYAVYFGPTHPFALYSRQRL